MKDSKIYSSMILSILSSSKDKHSAFKAVQQNFDFQGTLRMDMEQLLKTHQQNEIKLILECVKLVEQFNKDEYPYLAGISLKQTRGSKSYSS